MIVCGFRLTPSCMVYDVWLFYIYTVEEILACCSRNVAHGDLLKWSVTRNQKNYNGHLGKPSQKGWMVDQLMALPKSPKMFGPIFEGLIIFREVHQTQQNFWFCHRILGTLLWTKDTIQGYHTYSIDELRHI